MSNKDVFSSLYRWAHRQGENFTTEAFIYLVNKLIERDEPVARSFLGWLCFKDESCAAFASTLPTVSAHYHGEDGIPDIWIETPNVLVLIEVKKGSDLHEGQLGQYHRVLEADGRTRGRTGQLVLLTVFDATFAADEKPHAWWRWADVERWLDKKVKVETDAIVSFLAEQFLAFLRSQVMTANRVEWQYVEGVKSMVSLTAMLEEACTTNNLTGTKGGAPWNWRGLSIGDQFWTGVYFDNPDVVVFEYTKQDAVAQKRFAPGHAIRGKPAPSRERTGPFSYWHLFPRSGRRYGG